MKNFFFSVVIITATLASCSAVSSILQNTFPYNSTIVVTSGSPTNTTLSTVGAGMSINQIVNSSANVKDIKASTATLKMISGDQGMGIFKNIKVYLVSGNNEIMVAYRDNISDNIGNSLSLDVQSNQILDSIMKSGNGIQQKIVYQLKSTPTSDLNVKSSLSLNSVPIQK